MTPIRSVLVVDAEHYFRETIRDTLVDEGFSCQVAGSAAESQKVIEDPAVACVVLDVRAETPHALDLLVDLLAARPALRVIAVSGQTDQELVLEALRRGACDYLAKPIHDEELCLAVGRALDTYEAVLRGQAVSDRIGRLADRCAALEASVRDGAARETLAMGVVEAATDVLDASRAAVLRVAEDGSLRVEAARGGADLASPGELSVDLVSTGGVFGRLCAGERPGGEDLGGDDLSLLRLLAGAAERWLAPVRSVAAAPVEEVRAESQAELAASEALLELLRQMADATTREIEPARVFSASLLPVARLTSARAAAVYLIDNITGRLVREAGVEGSDVERADLPRDRGLTGGCLQSGALVATDRPERDPRFDPEIDTPESGAIGPMLVVPLRVRERVLGVARVFPSAEVGASARLGELLVAPLSAATRNVLLYRSLLESVEDVARARREAGGRPGAGPGKATATGPGTGPGAGTRAR